MSNLTKLWTSLHMSLHEMTTAPPFLVELNDNLSEVLSLKEVEEYQRAVLTDTTSPSQFKHLCEAMRRAMIEGYLLAKEESKVENLEYLSNCFKQERKQNEESNSTVTSSNVVNITSHNATKG